ncbi:MAG: right-handed parallel beta-helix repeat-containing protein [Deltaproteobacteria bacterium]|nr:right-handed parallel beta-helix repeat-containing protein [Deltaproteobacteria bacterium]
MTGAGRMRILSGIAIATLVGWLSACGSSSTNETTPADGGQEEGDATETLDGSRDGATGRDAQAEDSGADAEVVDPNAKFVSPSGDDGNDGSMDSPWRTIPYAVSQLQAGEMLYVREGTYVLESGDVAGEFRWDKDMIAPPSGQEGQPTVIRNYPGERALLDASGLFLDCWQGIIDIKNKEHIVIQGLVLIGTYAKDRDGQFSVGSCSDNHHHGYAGVMIVGSDDVEIRDMEVRKTTGSGIYAHGSTNLVVVGNDVGDCNKGGWEELISMSDCHGVEVAYNYVHDSPPSGIHNGYRKEGIDCKDGTSDALVHHNTVVNTSLGIYLDARGHMENIEVYANFLDGQGQGRGLQVANEVGGDTYIRNMSIHDNIVVNWAIDAGLGWDREALGWQHNNDFAFIYIYNNTFYGAQYLGFQFGLDFGVGYTENKRPHDIYIYNNIFAESGNYNLWGRYSDATSFVLDHNVVPSPTSLVGENALLEDPQFVDAQGALQGDPSGLVPISGSAVCSFGNADGSLPQSDEDFSGNARFGPSAGALVCQ